jgi:uncharacterized damage-inducible protein DinB
MAGACPGHFLLQPNFKKFLSRNEYSSSWQQWEKTLKTLATLALISFAAPLALFAQAPSNPVVSSAREMFEAKSKYIVAAAEEMPADKYSYHPTPDQWSYGKVTFHVIQASYAVCGMLSDTTPPQISGLSETSAKDALVTGLKASFDYCDKSLSGLQDSKLGDQITFFRGTKATRARALLELTVDLYDHYSQMASYLRLNGLTPPSAKPKK